MVTHLPKTPPKKPDDSVGLHLSKLIFPYQLLISPLELQEELIALLRGSSWSLGLGLLGGASLPGTMDAMDAMG